MNKNLKIFILLLLILKIFFKKNCINENFLVGKEKEKKCNIICNSYLEDCDIDENNDNKCIKI